MKLILPNRDITPQLGDGVRLYFLAGPIRGGGDWQARAIELLNAHDPDCYIVCPSRYIQQNHPLAQFAIAEDPNPTVYDNQTLWERHYLGMAAHHGAIIFWLPCQDVNNPRKPEDGPYGRDTYGELGRWSIRSAYKLNSYEADKPVRVVVGAEEGYPGLKQIRINFVEDHGGNFPIHSSLAETIEQAILLARQ